MTLQKLQNIVCKLANDSWCRYWVNWTNSEHGPVMAIQCRDDEGESKPITDAKAHGFEENEDFVYTILRTYDAGLPKNEN